MTVAIVTGASRGIGAEIAIQLSKDGMDVVVSYVVISAVLGRPPLQAAAYNH